MRWPRTRSWSRRSGPNSSRRSRSSSAPSGSGTSPREPIPRRPTSPRGNWPTTFRSTDGGTGGQMRLAEKVAIVSGAGTGIGAAVARLFAREGARVVLTGRRVGPIEAGAAEIGGGFVSGHAADPEHAAAAGDAATGTLGGGGILVAEPGDRAG